MVKKAKFALFLEECDLPDYCRLSNPTAAVRAAMCAKHFEYLLRLHKAHCDHKMRDEDYITILDFLGVEGLNYAFKRIMERVMASAAGSYTQRLFEAELDKALCEGSALESWQGICALLDSDFWVGSVKDAFDIGDLMVALLEYARKMQVKAKKPLFGDAFKPRLSALSDALQLDKFSQEMLTLSFARETNKTIGGLYDCLTEGDVRGYSGYAASILTGYSENEIIAAFSAIKERKELSAIEIGGSLPRDVVDYLRGAGSDNFLECYAAKSASVALPIENFECYKEARVVCSLISSHSCDRPLNVLFYGMEGSGKTELARSIAAQTGRVCYEVNLEYNACQCDIAEKDREENTAAYRARAVKMAELCLRKEKALLVVDEAVLILDGTEKSALNKLLEELRVPIIWIANDHCSVERTTRCRFQYSVCFDISNQTVREKLWDSVVEKHGAAHLFSQERRIKLAEKYEVAVGGIVLAVQNELALAKCGAHEEIGDEILEKHAELLGLKADNRTKSRAPSYDVSVLSIPRLEEVMLSAKRYAECLKNKETESNMTILLYGPPGTGKTEFARHIARECGLSFMEISYGQISATYVGETEKKLAAAFRQANDDGALLFLDEADSLIADRRGAYYNWEISQTNEFLVQLESAKCMVICSTNLQSRLDAASSRRFHFQLEFGFLKRGGILTMAEKFFPELAGESWEPLTRMTALTPGDFYAAYKRLQWLPREEVTAARVTRELEGTVNAKGPCVGGRRIGFCAA